MKLLGKIFLVFTIATFVELYLLVLLTRYTSIWVTIISTILCGMLGAYLARREGLRALKQLRAAMRLEQEPTTAIIDGAMLLVAAAFLFTPGVLTDVVGLLLLIPAVRRPIGLYVQKRIMQAVEQQLAQGTMQFFSNLGTDIHTDPILERKRGPVIDKRGGPIIDIDPER